MSGMEKEIRMVVAFSLPCGSHGLLCSTLPQWLGGCGHSLQLGPTHFASSAQHLSPIYSPHVIHAPKLGFHQNCAVLPAQSSLLSRSAHILPQAWGCPLELSLSFSRKQAQFYICPFTTCHQRPPSATKNMGQSQAGMKTEVRLSGAFWKQSF